MSSVISFKVSWKNGIISRSLLSHAWKEYNEKIHSTLESLLFKFDVLFPHPNNDFLIVPSMTEENPSDDFKNEWMKRKPSNEEIQWERLFRLGFIPLGFFPKIVANMMHIRGMTHNDLWRRGLIVHLERENGIVQFDNEKNQLLIRVRSPSNLVHPPRLLHDLVESVENVLSGFYSTKKHETKRMIPCNHCVMRGKNDQVKEFIMEECIFALSSGSNKVLCGNESINLSFLAPDLMFKEESLIKSSSLSEMKQIGKGGFGVVFKAKMKRGEESLDVAVKELYSDERNDGMDEKKRDEENPVNLVDRDKFLEFHHEVSIMR
jgi:hypothetical protein